MVFNRELFYQRNNVLVLTVHGLGNFAIFCGVTEIINALLNFRQGDDHRPRNPADQTRDEGRWSADQLSFPTSVRNWLLLPLTRTQSLH